MAYIRQLKSNPFSQKRWRLDWKTTLLKKHRRFDWKTTLFLKDVVDALGQKRDNFRRFFGHAWVPTIFRVTPPPPGVVVVLLSSSSPSSLVVLLLIATCTSYIFTSRRNWNLFSSAFLSRFFSFVMSLPSTPFFSRMDPTKSQNVWQSSVSIAVSPTLSITEFEFEKRFGWSFFRFSRYVARVYLLYLSTP